MSHRRVSWQCDIRRDRPLARHRAAASDRLSAREHRRNPGIAVHGDGNNDRDCRRLTGDRRWRHGDRCTFDRGDIQDILHRGRDTRRGSARDNPLTTTLKRGKGRRIGDLSDSSKFHCSEQHRECDRNHQCEFDRCRASSSDWRKPALSSLHISPLPEVVPMRCRRPSSSMRQVMNLQPA